MNKKIFLFSLALAAMLSAVGAKAQVTIGSMDEPKATLDVRKGGTKADGIIAPVLTGNELKGNDSKYGTDQTGAIVYVTAAASPTTTKTANVTAAGYYYFDGSVWQSLKGTDGGGGSEIVGNEVTDAANATLTRSGSGKDADPYKLAVNPTATADSIAKVFGSTALADTLDSRYSGASGGAFRLKVKIQNTTPYTITAADENYLLINTTPITYHHATLTADDAGLMVMVYNNSGAANYYSDPILLNTPQINSANGAIFVWTGTNWVAMSKQ